MLDYVFKISGIGVLTFGMTVRTVRDHTGRPIEATHLDDGGLCDHELGGPFEVILPDRLLVSGAVLADQVKSINRQIRRIKFAGKVPDSFVQDVQARIGPLPGLD
jgi:hypothetical protein